MRLVIENNFETDNDAIRLSSFKNINDFLSFLSTQERGVFIADNTLLQSYPRITSLIGEQELKHKKDSFTLVVNNETVYDYCFKGLPNYNKEEYSENNIRFRCSSYAHPENRQEIRAFIKFFPLGEEVHSVMTTGLYLMLGSPDQKMLNHKLSQVSGTPGVYTINFEKPGIKMHAVFLPRHDAPEAADYNMLEIFMKKIKTESPAGLFTGTGIAKLGWGLEEFIKILFKLEMAVTILTKTRTELSELNSKWATFTQN